MTPTIVTSIPGGIATAILILGLAILALIAVVEWLASRLLTRWDHTIWVPTDDDDDDDDDDGVDQ